VPAKTNGQGHSLHAWQRLWRLMKIKWPYRDAGSHSVEKPTVMRVASKAERSYKAMRCFFFLSAYTLTRRKPLASAGCCTSVYPLVVHHACQQLCNASCTLSGNCQNTKLLTLDGVCSIKVSLRYCCRNNCCTNAVSFLCCTRSIFHRVTLSATAFHCVAISCACTAVKKLIQQSVRKYRRSVCIATIFGVLNGLKIPNRRYPPDFLCPIFLAFTNSSCLCPFCLPKPYWPL